MKQIFFDGRLGKDAEVKTTANGRTFIHFSVANSSYPKGQEVTEWWDVYSFDPFVIESKSKVLKKGYYVLVTGSEDTKTSVGNDGKIYINRRCNATSIDVPNITGRSENNQGQANVQQVQVQQQPQMTTMPRPTQATVQIEAAQPVMQQVPVQQPVQQPQYQMPVPQVQPAQVPANSLDDDDLPF